MTRPNGTWTTRPGVTLTRADVRAMNFNPYATVDDVIHTGAGFVVSITLVSLLPLSFVTTSMLLTVAAMTGIALTTSAVTGLLAHRRLRIIRRRHQLITTRTAVPTHPDRRMMRTLEIIPDPAIDLIDTARDKATRLSTALAADVLNELDSLKYRMSVLLADIIDLATMPDALTSVQRSARADAMTRAADAMTVLNQHADTLATAVDDALTLESAAPTDAIAVLNARTADILNPDPTTTPAHARDLLAAYTRALDSLTP